MLTDLAIVVVPDGLPRDGSPVDVLVHLHGFEIWSDDRKQLYYGTGYEDARPRAGAQPIDIGVMQLEQQMAAAGRAVVGILPQGSASSDFSKASGKGVRPAELRHGGLRPPHGRPRVGPGRRQGAHARPGGPLRPQRRRPADLRRIEKYVVKRLNDDLANLRRAQGAAGNGAAKAQQAMKDYVSRRGFRLNRRSRLRS